MYAIAAVILFSLIGSVGWLNHTLADVADQALHEVKRIAEIQLRAQRTTLLAVEFNTTADRGFAEVARMSLLEQSGFFAHQQGQSFVPDGLMAQWIYRVQASDISDDAYAVLETRLRLLTQKTFEIANATTDLDREFALSAIRAQTRSDLLVDLDTLFQLHQRVLSTSLHLADSATLLLIPVVALAFYAIWRWMILPLRAREQKALDRLKFSESAARDLAETASSANHAKSEFLAVMSHEIRTPMNGVLGIAEVLDDMVEDPDQRELIAVLRDSGETLMKILNDILDFTRLEAGKVQFDDVPFAPRSLADRIRIAQAPLANAKGLDLEFSVDLLEDRQWIGDPHRIFQILTNIVSNAIKFTDKGSISVSIAPVAHGGLQLQISDTGIGMEEDEIARIFDWFVQADSSTARRYGGTGLGMSIVYRLVEAMQGGVHIDSEPGEGTVVTITLPLTEIEAAPEEAEQARDVVSIPPDLKILAVDDIETNLMVAEMILGRLGLKPTLARGGREAIELCADGGFDLLLLDISMPDVDGITALDVIRQRDRSMGRSPTPAIAVTANALAHQVGTYLDAGFDDHVAKPINMADLAQSISRLVAREGLGRRAA
ncbi:MAG: ATP-binding protein [Pseudomonadota bacterium]